MSAEQAGRRRRGHREHDGVRRQGGRSRDRTAGRTGDDEPAGGRAAQLAHHRARAHLDAEGGEPLGQPQRQPAEPAPQAGEHGPRRAASHVRPRLPALGAGGSVTGSVTARTPSSSEPPARACCHSCGTVARSESRSAEPA